MKPLAFLRAAALCCLPFSYALPAVAGPSAADLNRASVQIKSVQIQSDPTNATVTVNGTTVGRTPCLVDIAVNPEGQAIRPIVIRAQKLPAFAYEAERYFPGRERDGATNIVPTVLLFDLNVQRVVTVR
jgi:hypothetical protein